MIEYNYAPDSALCEKLKAILSSKLAPGATAAAFAMLKDNRLIAECACGADVQDLFCVGSISKVYCAAAIMQLVDRGLVDLDLPVAKYLPRFKMMDPRYKDITVRMALNHSSGLPGTCVKSGFTRDSLSQGAIEDCFYEYFASSSLKAAPGTFSVYCNDGFILAELIVKEVSGLTLAEYVRKYITGPIGATSTCYTHEPTKHNQVVMGSKPEVIMLSGAGGVTTNMADLCRFGAIFLNGGGGILSPFAVKEICKKQGRTQIDDPAALCYGLGWDTVSGHTPSVHFGPNFIGLHTADCQYDLGENVCVKSGTSTQVKSILFVIPEHNAVCAMAVTLDAGVSRDEMLPVLYAECMHYLGNEICRPLPNAITDKVKADESFSGYYLSGPNLIMCDVQDCYLSLYACVGEMRVPMFTNLTHIGNGMFCINGQPACRLLHSCGRDYILTVLESTGFCCVAERPPILPNIPDAWRKRIGTHWICINADASDISIEGNGAIACISISKNIPNMLLFESNSPDAHGVVATPFAAAGNNNGSMFLNGSSMSSRDACDPHIFINGTEAYMSCGGFIYASAESLPIINEGSYSIEANEKNLAYRIPPEVSPTINVPENGTVLYFNKAYERIDSPVPGGIALMIGSKGATFSVKLSHKTIYVETC